MRSREFLSESTLQSSSTSSWPTYLANLITAKDIGVGPQGEKRSGQQLDGKSKKIVTDLITLLKNNSNTGESIYVDIMNVDICTLYYFQQLATKKSIPFFSFINGI